MPLDVDPRNRMPERPDVTDWNPSDKNPCRECTSETCEWWGFCPHAPITDKDSSE